ncbi:MAG: DUF2953 domain-containing protein [Clostridia bacterium]|nr:DUF2953 domain-containing protein [Clostridia bacterium]
MWVVYILLGLAALLLLILLVPVYGRVTYDGELHIRAWVLGVPVTVLPRPKEDKPPKKHTKKVKKKATEKPSRFKELTELLRRDDVEGTLHFLSGVAALAGRTVGRLLRAITVKRLWLQMRIATGDPATTAQRYGQVCGVLYPTLELIAERVRIRRRELRVEPNFLLDSSAARFDIRLRVSVWRVLGAGIALLWGFMILNEQDKPQEKKEVT